MSGLIHIVGLAVDEMCFASVGHLKLVSCLSLNLDMCDSVLLLFHLSVPALMLLLLLSKNVLECLE